MVSYNILSTLLATCLCTGTVAIKGDIKEDPVSTRIMTYNIRYDNLGDGINNWGYRKEQVVNLIRFHQPEIIGIQEALYHQVIWLSEQFADLRWSGVGRTNGKRGGELSPIFYSNRRFEMLNEGTFWLSPSPGEPGKGWDAVLPRIVTWVELKEKKSGRSLFIFNTHFDHFGEEARKQSARLILKETESIAAGKPFVLTGDFNMTPESEPYTILAATLKDGFYNSRFPHYGPENTFFDEGGSFNVDGGQGGRRIDYIFVNPLVDVAHHGIIGTFRDGRFPSDHLPVVADIEF